MAQSIPPHLNLCTPGQSLEENIDAKELRIFTPYSQLDNYQCFKRLKK